MRARGTRDTRDRGDTRDTREIVGAGARTLYIAFKDENDIQHIRRHPWP